VGVRYFSSTCRESERCGCERVSDPPEIARINEVSGHLRFPPSEFPMTLCLRSGNAARVKRTIDAWVAFFSFSFSSFFMSKGGGSGVKNCDFEGG